MDPYIIYAKEQLCRGSVLWLHRFFSLCIRCENTFSLKDNESKNGSKIESLDPLGRFDFKEQFLLRNGPYVSSWIRMIPQGYVS